MRRPTILDWIGATGLWFGATLGLGVLLSEGMGAPDEVGVTTFFVFFGGGIAAARIWWLKRPGPAVGEAEDRNGLTTGEMTAQRLELMEQRIYELEERLELTERMLLQAQPRQPLPAGREPPRP